MSGAKDDCFQGDDKMLPFLEGMAILEKSAHTVVGAHTVSLAKALGRIVAQDILAPFNVPPHDNAAVDGYGVAFADLNSDGETRLSVSARIAAGHPLDHSVADGTAVQIFTGGAMAVGIDTVVMQEHVTLDGADVIFPSGISLGDNRRLQGEDVQQGDVIIKAGTLIRAQEIGLAASIGLSELKVYRALRVAVFSTGDEISDPVFDGADTVGNGQGKIYDVNRYSIAALLKGLGCEVTDLGILHDQVGEIRSALHDAAPGHDLIITSGGVSLGEEDHITHVVESLGSIEFWRLAIKPGRPMAFGKIVDTAFLGLPGNPVAAMVVFMRVARPLLLKMSGRTNTDIPAFQVPAGFAMKKKKGRREWLRASLEQDENGVLTVVKFPKQGAGILTSMVATDGLVELLEETETVAQGDLVRFLSFRDMTI
ncbi:MAG: molybdopterin molybdotransferase MoeA [Magnetovibrio sp.]|nr:molybdopterin molybdotransferase MoeA [Magnetovibrio sp.]